jgi:hypothetical protein
MKKKIVLFCIVFIIGAFLLYQYIYKDHRDISTEKASFAISVLDLKKEYNENDSLANVKYLDKTIQIYGSITNIDLSNKMVTIDSSLTAIIKGENTSLKVDDKLKIKGRFIGYDDLLEEFKMDECTIIE